MKITKEFKFCAGHRLMHHDGKCHNLHGHNYRVQFSLEGGVNLKTGMVADFSSLNVLKEYIMKEWDHGMLLNVSDIKLIEICKESNWKFYTFLYDPTVETMVRKLLEVARNYFDFGFDISVGVKIWETDNCFAEEIES